MELVVALAAFYLAYSIVHLSPAATVFRPGRCGKDWKRGERLVLASIWPGRIDVIGERLLRPEWLTSLEAPHPPSSSDDVIGRSVTIKGRRVVVDGRTLFRVSTSQGAEWLRSLFSKNHPETKRDSSERVADAVARSLSPDGARRRIDEIVSESRYLGIYNSLYLVLVFLVVPFLALRWEANEVLLLMWPIVATLHVGAALELWRVHGQVSVTTSEERFTEVLTGFLFPPALLRSRHELVQAVVCRLHPAVLAAVLLNGEPLRQFLTGELAYIDGCRDGRSSSLLTSEREAVLEVAAASGWTEAELRAPRTPRDRKAACYCPRCNSEYLKDIGHCSDCGSRTITCGGPDPR